ncbi:BRO family protein [Roseomonas sp. GC11]|uniref:BRO-N domain-containing protein n=1 Tax=Roseomonas sp. GC11 TaxID=2950546 RepID=UPI00210CD415|nr:BRO family protein [Roseomonas sp. GC11]MCQ4162775.1 BRO family protein [Roseomonas sp. GC11]
MTTPAVFTFPETHTPVRTVMIDGQPWFVAADVCRCLDLPVGNGNSAYRKLAPGEMTKGDRITFGMLPGKPLILISESGLYKLIMRSDKPEARQFQAWVTREVLPAIRKDGVYVRGEELLKQPALLEVDDRIQSLLKRKADEKDACSLPRR